MGRDVNMITAGDISSEILQEFRFVPIINNL